MICREDFCALDDNSDDDGNGDESDDLSEEECAARCDRFWCRTESRCLSRNDQLQGEERALPDIAQK